MARKVPRPIVAPGPNPRGPPGWSEEQQERIADQNTAVSQGLPSSAAITAPGNVAASAAGNSVPYESMLPHDAGASTLTTAASEGAGAENGNGSWNGHANGASGSNGVAAPFAPSSQQHHPPPPQQPPQHPLAAEPHTAADLSTDNSNGTASGNDALMQEPRQGAGHSRVVSGASTQSAASATPSSASKSSPGRVRSKLHKLGEKLSLVPPRSAEAGSSTQNASTMPEIAG